MIFGIKSARLPILSAMLTLMRATDKDSQTEMLQNVKEFALTRKVDTEHGLCNPASAASLVF